MTHSQRLAGHVLRCSAAMWRSRFCARGARHRMVSRFAARSHALADMDQHLLNDIGLAWCDVAYGEAEQGRASARR